MFYIFLDHPPGGNIVIPDPRRDVVVGSGVESDRLSVIVKGYTAAVIGCPLVIYAPVLALYAVKIVDVIDQGIRICAERSCKSPDRLWCAVIDTDAAVVYLIDCCLRNSGYFGKGIHCQPGLFQSCVKVAVIEHV